MAIDRPKLLVILGAGSSIGCGMPSVSQLDELMRKWSEEWSVEDHFRPDGGEGAFNTLWRLLDGYYEKNPRSALALKLNYEKVLGEMLALASWVAPSPFGNTLSLAVENSALSRSFILPESGAFAASIALRDQYVFLLRRLASYMRDSCEKRSPDENFSAYSQILSGLCDEFDVGVYNLNYDNLAVTAWPEAITGFGTDGEFNPLAVHQRSEWGFIYHLHGSVHYSFSDPVSRIQWEPDLAAEHVQEIGWRAPLASDFKAVPLATLIAGGFKLDQLLAEPFQSHHASLVRHASEADAVLIGGYGFGDVHVNRTLMEHFTLSRRAKAERPHAVVLDYADEPNVPSGSRHDLWAHEVKQCLGATFDRKRQQSGDGPLEIDGTGRVATWYGGYIQAERILDSVVKHLKS